MSIVVISRTGYHSEEKNVRTGKGVIVVENLVPNYKDESKLKAVEAELYNVFSKYQSGLDKSGGSCTVSSSGRS